MTAGREVSGDQVDRLIERLDGLVSRLDAFIMEVKLEYVREEAHSRDLKLIDRDFKEVKADIDSMRTNLSRVVFLLLGAFGSIVIAFITALMIGQP
jgi:hypothetical protein